MISLDDFIVENILKSSYGIPTHIGKAAAFVFFVFAEGCKYQRVYIFIPKIAQRILIVLVWNITIHS